MATLALFASSAGLALLAQPRATSVRQSAHRHAWLLMAAEQTLPDLPEVRWFPALDVSKREVEPSGTDDAGVSVMPLFPLGAAYLPHTTPVLNIFEPRYRKMYNDILFNGARRFMVTNVDEETGRLAEVGVVFYLEDLKEVSQQTDDRVKYVGQHKVIGRVKLLNVLNPSALVSRETYLRAEVSDVEDEAEELDEDEEAAVSKLFIELVGMQKELGEEPRFTEAVKGRLSFHAGGDEDDKGLWGTILLWQQFLEQRTAVLAQRMQREIQQSVAGYLQQNSIGQDLVNSKGEIRLEDLPPDLLNTIRNTQSRYREELEALDADPSSSFQQMLQSTSHRERLVVFRALLSKERQRLSARAMLASVFKSS